MRCRLSTVCTNHRIGLQAAWVGDLQAACPVSQYPPALQGRCLKKTAKRLLDSRVRGNDDASVPCLPTSSSCTRRPTITNNSIVARTKGRWNDESRSHHTCPTSHLTVIPANAGIQYLSHMPIQPAIYILASRRNGTLYIGATSDLVQRVWQHKTTRWKVSANVMVWTGWCTSSCSRTCFPRLHARSSSRNGTGPGSSN